MPFWWKAHDEWQVSERRYLSEGSMAPLCTPPACTEGGSHAAFSRHSQRQPADQITVKIIYTTQRDVALDYASNTELWPLVSNVPL